MKIDGYKYGNKNNWRRWTWNRVCERLTIPAKDALVVYLPGKEDLDRPVAISHGFRPENLIAVDKNLEVVKELRNKNVLCAHMTLDDMLFALPYTSIKIDVLIADFCCGLTEDMTKLIWHFQTFNNSKVFNQNAIIVINLMRGRDNYSLLKAIKEVKIEEKHRGKLFIQALISAISQNHIDTLIEVCKINNFDFLSKVNMYLSNKFQCKTIDDYHQYIIQRIYKIMNPIFNEYSNNNIHMDSIIITFKSDKFLSAYEYTLEMKQRYTDKIKSLIALSAIRTMRKNGVLDPCPTF